MSFCRFASFQRSRGRHSIRFYSIWRFYKVIIVVISSGRLLILFSERSTFIKFLLNRFRLTNFRLMRGILRSVSCEFWSRWYRRLGALAAFGPLVGLLEACWCWVYIWLNVCSLILSLAPLLIMCWEPWKSFFASSFRFSSILEPFRIC